MQVTYHTSITNNSSLGLVTDLGERSKAKRTLLFLLLRYTMANTHKGYMY